MGTDGVFRPFDHGRRRHLQQWLTVCNERGLPTGLSDGVWLKERAEVHRSGTLCVERCLRSFSPLELEACGSPIH